MEVLIRGGRVLDPAQGIDAVRDVAIANGKIAAVAEGLKVSPGATVIEARGKIVTPGIIDLHAHVYDGVTRFGLAPDQAGVNAGVTTVVDAGSAGPATFAAFPKYVLPQAKTEVFCFLHICVTGLCCIPEIRDWKDIDYEATVSVARAHPGLIKGIKVRCVEPALGNMGLELFKIAKRVAREVGMPLMVHIGDAEGVENRSRILTLGLLPLLERGDILSHCFTGKPGRAMLPDGRVMPELRQAAQRGVVLDIAHGTNNFSFDVARQALEQGLLPQTISTDLTARTIKGPVFSQTHTMSKFLALGLSLNQVVEMSTINSARALGEEARLGSLRVGLAANVSLLELREGEWRFTDAEGVTITGKKLLVPWMTVKDGAVITCTS